MDATRFHMGFGKSHAQLLMQAYSIAQSDSQDNSTWNGAVLTDEYGQLLCVAANFYPGPVVHERPAKYAFVEHAERAVIYLAAKSGIRTRGARMYCPWASCADCARAIVLAGITELYFHETEVHHARPEWDQSISQGDTILDGKVKKIAVPGYFDCEILFGGKKVKV